MKERLAGSLVGLLKDVSSAGADRIVKLGFWATGGGRGLVLTGTSLLTVLLDRESKLLESAAREVVLTCSDRRSLVLSSVMVSQNTTRKRK